MGAATMGVKSVQTIIYILIFLAAAIVLALYSYFLATERIHHASVPNKQRAIEGISGAGVLYSIFAVILTCFLGGISFFAFIGIFLDILFCGGFIAIAILTRDGVHSCTANYINTPIGSGNPNTDIGRDGKKFSIKLKTACRMEKVVFAVSIIGAALFLLAALFQLWLGRRHQKDKRYGPSPANNYTSGSSRGGFFSRRRHASPPSTTQRPVSLAPTALALLTTTIVLLTTITVCRITLPPLIAMSATSMKASNNRLLVVTIRGRQALVLILMAMKMRGVMPFNSLLKDYCRARGSDNM